jgi:7-cyano-7-deazaguanine synthase
VVTGADAPPVAVTAVLFSGGLDSAVLLAHETRRAEVLPIYVSAGLAWESAERRAAERLLRHPLFAGRTRQMIELSLPVDDVYPSTHWALRGDAPGYDTPDRDVYLVGRNVLLLAKAAILCARTGIDRIALGPLAGNPFPDARPAFFTAMEAALSLGLNHPIVVARPFEAMHKGGVIALGASLGVPFALTLSCMNASDGGHCGACSKCRERQQGFVAAGVADPTVYATPPGDTRAEGPRL